MLLASSVKASQVIPKEEREREGETRPKRMLRYTLVLGCPLARGSQSRFQHYSQWEQLSFALPQFRDSPERRVEIRACVNGSEASRTACWSFDSSRTRLQTPKLAPPCAGSDAWWRSAGGGRCRCSRRPARATRACRFRTTCSASRETTAARTRFTAPPETPTRTAVRRRARERAVQGPAARALLLPARPLLDMRIWKREKRKTDGTMRYRTPTPPSIKTHTVRQRTRRGLPQALTSGLNGGGQLYTHIWLSTNVYRLVRT